MHRRGIDSAYPRVQPEHQSSYRYRGLGSGVYQPCLNRAPPFLVPFYLRHVHS